MINIWHGSCVVNQDMDVFANLLCLKALQCKQSSFKFWVVYMELGFLRQLSSIVHLTGLGYRHSFILSN